ncbi:MAG: DUF2809 domain-containing protein [Ruminococcaceae bacterium]|nr:DUF2809 domain-containing protein [Oscillospiraceae bacterium]
MKKKLRLIYLFLFLIIFITEISIALFVHDSIIRPYLGDILVTMLIYAFARIFFPEGLPLIPLYVFLFATAIEIGQYFDFVKLMGLEDNKVICVVLGRTFSWGDLLCYGAGCIAFYFTEKLIKRRR